MTILEIILLLVVIILTAIVISYMSTHKKSFYGSHDKPEEMFVQSPWFEEINKGTKTIEGRVGPARKFDHLVGRHLLMKNPRDRSNVLVKVVKVVHYDSLDDYVNGSGWENVAPHTKSKDETLRAYKNIFGRDNSQVFSDGNIKSRGGMNAIHIEKV